MSLKQIAAHFREAARYDWRAIARPEQLEPPGNWSTWLILAGRGWGKTRCGAEWVRSMVCGPTPLSPGRYRHVALVAETAADCRDVMIGDGRTGEGSGLLQVHPPDFRPTYESSKRRLTWPNGAIATLYSSEEPDQLRGPQHDAAWVDELAKFASAQDVWDQLQIGLRLGLKPRVLVTTTPTIETAQGDHHCSEHACHAWSHSRQCGKPRARFHGQHHGSIRRYPAWPSGA
jgi:phage terminase large subunit-like protein